MRAFVVGNGPSLARTHLHRLIGDVSYGMQRIHLIYPHTEWRPTYWVCTDRDPDNDGRWMQDALWHITQYYPCYFRSHWIGDLPHRDNVRFLHMCAHYDDGLGGAQTPTAWHLPEICRYGGSMATALQLALLAGYEPVYLVGADLGLTPNAATNHFHPDYGRRLPADEVERDNIMLANMHRLAHEAYKAAGVPIFNATLGGLLEEYPRVDFHSLFGKTD